MYRKATLNDCEKVYNLICDMECKRLSFDRFYSIYQEQIKNEHYYCLICEHDDNVIGVLNLRFEDQLHHSECIAEIMEFAVDEAYRKQLRQDTHRFYLREGMHNFHFKFSKSLVGNDTVQNAIGT